MYRTTRYDRTTLSADEWQRLNRRANRAYRARLQAKLRRHERHGNPGQVAAVRADLRAAEAYARRGYRA